MKQTKILSIIEQFCNVGSGLGVAYLYWLLVLVPIIEADIITIHDTLIITLQFTVISVIRGYYWRRFFANDIHLYVANFIKSNIPIDKK